jgi:3-hydroxyacyl-CoA dehydrogenase
MNRLQAALIGEMLRLVSEGVVSPEGADRMISEGFGLRWAFLGPFEGVDLNAPGGIADYLGRYGFIFDELSRERGGEAVVTAEVVARIDRELRARYRLDQQGERVAARDRAIAALRALRSSGSGGPKGA